MIQPFRISDICTAFSTDRDGGESTGNYSSFNINEHCGDDPRAIMANRKLLLSSLSIDEDRLIMPHQTHSDNILAVDNKFLALSQEERKLLLENKDALITTEKKTLIAISTADCIPVLLIDERKKAAAAIHAGWRGTCKRITEKTIMRMEEEYGTRPEDIRAVIGPGISLDSFEVGDEVYEAFSQNGFDMERIAARYDKWHIDLKMCNRIQMESLGVREGNILTSPVCTFISWQSYFSARRLGIKSGRILSGILIK